MTHHHEEEPKEKETKTRTTSQQWARLEKVKGKIVELEAERDSLIESLKQSLPA